ncbi:MAG: hypothetical protein IKQ46_17080 [Bacteroidales bacterium]|jgi:hypothetical protein|nr:hypothetical protein [Bacteroidales bacterium]
MRRIISIFVTALLLASIVACSDTSSHKRGNRNNDNVEFSEVKNVVYTKYGIPLPVDLFTYMVKQEVLFNYDLLIPLENREKYTKETKQAMALGVYSADVAYCSIYGRQQEVLDYFNCAFKIADRLDISEGFTYKSIERIENNIASADSLSFIANESYWKACNYLDENEKNNILPFVIYGGWVESQYLTIKSNDLKSTKAIILEQKQGLVNLIDYLYEVMIESTAFYYNYDIKAIILKLNNIKNVYDKIPGEDIDPQLYKDISSKIASMRSELIDPKSNL